MSGPIAKGEIRGAQGLFCSLQEAVNFVALITYSHPVAASAG